MGQDQCFSSSVETSQTLSIKESETRSMEEMVAGASK